MGEKLKSVLVTIHGDLMFMDCPYCGKTLIKTDMVKIRVLLDAEGDARGKICPKCGGVVVLRLSSEIEKAVRARIAADQSSRDRSA